MTPFSDKSVLITGASRGIGEAVARRFASYGANVVLLARSTQALTRLADELDQGGGRVLAMPGDVSVYGDVERAVKKAVKRYGRLDILVNNAGVIEPISRLADSDPDAWGKAIDINVKGVYHGLRAALPVMRVVVNISSGAATSALEGWSQY